MPRLTFGRSDSYTSARIHTLDRSAMSNSVSAGVTRMPWIAVFPITNPGRSA